MKTLLISFMALSAVVMISCSRSNTDKSQTPLSSSDSLFAIKASQANVAEIDAGKVSLMNAGNDYVKMFGQMMIDDHTKSKASLDSIGRLLGFNMPDSADSAHIALKMKLMMLQGQAFDTTYIDAQVADHKTVLALLESEMNNSSANSKLRDYATKNYPVVQMHLVMADSLQQKLPH
jgi:putative membrane protein